ncbi:hypothetical protein LJC24_05605, partial [Desulfococcaceae bacterium OttesenSCG-928-F15]|nr:hypothetical protein [Desulfococcaceae bacterium OttesenSCG-928-F15]
SCWILDLDSSWECKNPWQRKNHAPEPWRKLFHKKNVGKLNHLAFSVNPSFGKIKAIAFLSWILAFE